MTKEMQIWPNFLVVGTARSGTTSLHEYLGNHPSIFMPLQKEPCFFTFYNSTPQFKDAKHNYTTTIDAYMQLFSNKTEPIRGESSTPYMYFYEQSIANMKALLPDYAETKILIMLRDPAERAYSQYMHNRRDLLEPLSFEEAIQQEQQRMEQNYHFDFFYVDKGYYFKQVKSFLDNFKHVKIVFHEDLEQNPNRLLNDIYQFLGVEANLNKEQLKKRNQSGEMKVKWFKQIISTRKNPLLNFFRKLMSRDTKKRLRNWFKSLLLKYNLKKSDMDPIVRKRLVALYQNDIKQLEVLINKDLTSWLK